MPYYFGEGSSGWEEYQVQAEAENFLRAPHSRFAFVEPWQSKAVLLAFARDPAPQGPAPIEVVGPGDWVRNWHAQQKRKAEEALDRVARAAQDYRRRGIRKVFGFYDGGNDEGFTHFRAIEMTDGRRLAAKELVIGGMQAELIAHAEQTIEQAVTALLGPGFGTGPYEMLGAVTIDCEACTITDEQDPEIVFAQIERGQ